MADNFRFFQAQPFYLYGAGAVAGDTTVTLKEMLDIDGNAVTMAAFFGTEGYATIEPGNGANEEQIVFTGLTNNANGTTTLTGVSSVTFEYPYTQTSGLAKTHAGSTTLVISNTSGFYNKLTAKDDDETIVGAWQFPNGANTPTLGTSYVAPTLNNQVASKGYADSLAIAGAPDATTTQKGIVELATQAEVDAGTATGGTGASLVATPAVTRGRLISDYVVDTGVADAYVIAPSPAITAYAAGQVFSFKSAHTNTTTSTIAVNGLATKTIKKLNGSTNLAAGDIVAGQIIWIEYDGTNFQMTSPSAVNNFPAISASNINEVIGTTDGATFVFMRPYDYQVFTGSGTWTKPTNLAGTEMVMVQAWGAGGSGGGGNSTTSGGAGGGGGYSEARFRASDLGSTVTVTIGAGGAAITGGNNGNAGGITTFGSLLTAYGGGGGSVAGAGGASNGGGGGGGGGLLSAGASASTSATGGAGGNPAGGAAGTASMGAGGAGSKDAGGGSGGIGGGGGAGGSTAAQVGGSSYDGGGGGGSADATNPGAGGTSVLGGAGGAGSAAGNATNGSAPGGGGGSTFVGTAHTSGAGARGECRVWVIY